MQTVLMQVDVLALFWVIRNHHIFPIPKHIFDAAHLTPVWGTVAQGNGHMLPPPAITGKDMEEKRLAGNRKCAVVPDLVC